MFPQSGVGCVFCSAVPPRGLFLQRTWESAVGGGGVFQIVFQGCGAADEQSCHQDAGPTPWGGAGSGPGGLRGAQRDPAETAAADCSISRSNRGNKACTGERLHLFLLLEGGASAGTHLCHLFLYLRL